MREIDVRKEGDPPGGIADFNILDVTLEPVLADILKLIALSTGCQDASISVPARDHAWFREAFGLRTAGRARISSLVAIVYQSHLPLAARNTSEDPRWRRDDADYARFYAGVPICAADGSVLGVLCATDPRPRDGAAAVRVLSLCAPQVVSRLELLRNERHLAEERVALRTHEQFFELAPDLLCTLDPSLRIHESSPSWQRLLGWSDSELRTHSLLELAHPDDCARTRDEAARLLAETGHGNNFPLRLKNASGNWVDLSWSWNAQAGVIYAVARDVSAERAREQELLAANERLQDRELRLRALFDAVVDGIIVQDAKGQVTSVNAAAERILGHSGDYLAAQNAFSPPIATLVRRDGRPMPDEERPTAIAHRTGGVVTDCVMGLQREERTTWLSVNATPLRKDGTVTGVVATVRDMTARIELEEALRLSEATFRVLVETLPIGICVSQGRVMRFVNQALVQMHGYESRSELEGREAPSVVHPNSMQAMLERYADMARGTHPGPGTIECLRKDGSSVLVEVSSLPRTFNGEPGTLAIIRDVTESLRARQAQERSEARFRALVDFAPVGIYEVTTEGKCVYVNERMTEICGLSREEMLQTGWLGAVHPDDVPALIAKRAEAMANNPLPLKHQLRFVGPRGVVHAMSQSVALTVNGVATSYLGALVDLTELHAAREALAKSEANFRRLAERAPVGIGVRVGPVVTYANAALMKMMGAEHPSQLVGRSAAAGASPRFAERVAGRLAAIEAGETVAQETLGFLRPDGEEVMLQVDSINLEFDGVPATMSMVRDVTELERTRAERDLAHTALLESLAQKETLLKEIHHRVKNNLQVIASLLRLGRGQVQDPSALNLFNDSIARVHSIALIHERLYQSHNLDHIDMASYLPELIAEVLRANATRLDIQSRVLASNVTFDVDRCVPIGLIVNELVTNAVKHAFATSTGRLPSLMISLEERAEDYELVIRDNGTGFDMATSREGSLGLLIVRSLVRQLCGHHHVEHVDGTAWHIVFPKQPLEGHGEQR